MHGHIIEAHIATDLGKDVLFANALLKQTHCRLRTGAKYFENMSDFDTAF